MSYAVDDKVQVNLGGGLAHSAWTDGVVEEVRDDGRLRILVPSGRGWRRVTRQPMFVRKPIINGDTP